MLTSQHSIVDYRDGRAVPDCLTRRCHAQYVELARRMLQVYSEGAGRTRRELHQAVEAVFAQEGDCPVRRIQSFCKLLDDRSAFQTDRRGLCAALRLDVFTAAARLHPLVQRADALFENEQQEAKQRIAAELDLPLARIEARLYADVMAFQPLESFQPYEGPDALLNRYNVAQAQACLYRATSLCIEARRDFRQIVQWAKLARLLLEIEPLSGGYRIRLSGPASVLRHARLYGVNMARFLPALLACREWRLQAVIRTPWNTDALLTLSDRGGLRSSMPTPEDFDSSVEERFAERFGPLRDGWTLIREGAVLQDRQAVFVPDFLFRHEDGTEVLLEIVGFWTPEYLRKKREVLRRFASHRILLAVAESSLRADAECGPDVIVYKKAIKPEAVIEALERRRKALLSPPPSGDNAGRRCL